MSNKHDNYENVKTKVEMNVPEKENKITIDMYTVSPAHRSTVHLHG